MTPAFAKKMTPARAVEAGASGPLTAPEVWMP
jgi:hypothetical protein